MAWSYHKIDRWVKTHGQGEVLEIFEPTARPQKGMTSKVKGRSKIGIRVPQDPMIYSRKRKNACRLISNAQIARSTSTEPVIVDPPIKIPQPVQRQLAQKETPPPPRFPTRTGGVGGRIQIGTVKTTRGTIEPIFR